MNPRRWKELDLKVKTAALVTGMNIVLTGIKFLLYFFSGSMAILAEAWHSFTDIATSFLVFIAVRRSSLKARELEVTGNTDDTKNLPQQFSSKMELLISFCIGLLLTIVAVSLIKKFIQVGPLPIENALVSGLLFLLFSLGSYCIYHLETHIGKKEGSLGLVSDGMHARADMTSSLLTGFSLIVYSMGLNLDRWVAGLIALFILSFALETIFNVALVYFHKESEYLFRYRSLQIIALLFDKNSMEKMTSTIKTFLEKKFGHKKIMKVTYKASLYVPFIALLIVYLSTVIFKVGIREQAIIERCGKPLSLKEPAGPGLHLKLPWPLDRVQKVRTTYIEELNIGNITDKQTRALIWTRKHGTEEPFLSGDNNFFYPYIVLHYRIKNIFQYLYKNADAKVLVKEVAHRVATVLFAHETFYNIAATHRKRLELEVLNKLQKNLDELESGIELLAVNLKDIHPPISIADSFERVIAGYQEKQRIINDALGYQNKVLPESRGKAVRELEEAGSYIIDRKKKAEGNATRFILSLPRYKQEKQIAMSRIYLQTIQEILREKTKIVVEPGSGEPELWMDFESFFPMEWKGGKNK